jgi:type I restriction enzyme R subunit
LSANFGHLKDISPELHRLGVLAERFFADDANTSLIKSRQFGEYMVKEIAALSGIYDIASRETTHDLLRRLATQQVLPREVADIFHAVRRSGNEATHSLAGSPAEALAALKFCRALGIWYRRTYGRDPDFKPGPFVPPKPSQELDQVTQSELAALRRQVQEAEAQLAAAHASADELTKARAAAEELALQAAEESAVWEQTAVEIEANQAELARKLSELQKQAETQPQQLQMEFKQAGLQAASRLELDERQTRRLIDVQLVDAGWEADSDRLTYQMGARPKEGQNFAIAEWPSEGGRADYALFVGLICVGVIEAKRESVDVPSTLHQAERYARTIDLPLEHRHADGPWKYGLADPFRVPFVRQWQTKSGIWFCDLRRDTNHPRPLTAWFSPKDLIDILKTNLDAAAQGLAEESFGKGKMRPYQEEAIASVEDAIVTGQRDILVSMATGTGKTRTSIALMYRLLKHKRFRRILFLVDRKALGKQASDALEVTEIEGMLNFAQIYKVAGLEKKVPEDEDQVQVATVQSLIARILNEPNPAKRPTPGTFDCIIVDEAHRGYTLDAELRESDIGFRNLDDYQSAAHRDARAAHARDIRASGLSLWLPPGRRRGLSQRPSSAEAHYNRAIGSRYPFRRRR